MKKIYCPICNMKLKVDPADGVTICSSNINHYFFRKYIRGC